MCLTRDWPLPLSSGLAFEEKEKGPGIMCQSELNQENKSQGYLGGSVG